MNCLISQIRRSRQGVVFGIAVTLLLASCSSKKPTPKTELTPKSKIDQEADAKAQEWWDASVAQCAGNYYTILGEMVPFGPQYQPRTNLYEFKSPSLMAMGEQLTEADRLNGYEWKGLVVVHVSTFRYMESGLVYGIHPDWKNDFKWTEWLDSKDFSARFRKKNGRWTEDVRRIGALDLDIDVRAKPTCSEIPQ